MEDGQPERRRDKNPLSEMFTDISRNRSDKYPYHVQDYMDIVLHVNSQLLCLVFNDPGLCSDFVNYVYNLSLAVQERYFGSRIDVEKEVSGVADSFVTMIDLDRNGQFESGIAKALLFGTCLTICSTIEKILRNVVLKEIKNDEYLDAGKTSLSEILQRYRLKDVSKGLKYYLEFYLIKEVSTEGNGIDRPGRNLRNNLMHGHDDAYEKTDYGTCLMLFYLLLSLLGDLFLTIE